MFILATSLSSQVNPDWRTYVMQFISLFYLLLGTMVINKQLGI